MSNYINISQAKMCRPANRTNKIRYGFIPNNKYSRINNVYNTVLLDFRQLLNQN